MSFASLRRIVRSAKKGLCSSCAKAKHPQLEAAGIGHVGCLMYTVDTGGLNVRDEFNASALHMAARKGQIAVLIYLIQNKIATEVYRAANGATPAHDAAGTGNLDCLRYLIIHSSCSSHDRDLNGSTPLHWAVQFGHLQVVAWLVLEGNAQVDAVTKTGVTPLHLAASKGHTTILRWLINHAYKKHANPMRLVNSRARNGATPIYFAAQEGHIEIVKWLAEKAGGDPTIFSNAGMAPLHAAAQEGHLECVQYLFRFGLATSAGGLRSRQDGASALHYAACQGHEGIVGWLLSQKECTGSEKDFIGSTPVHDAADEGRVRILQVFYNHGVNLAAENSQGDTPLDLARRRAMTVCIQFLETALKRKKLRPPSTKKEVANHEEDQLLLTEVADFYSASPATDGGGKWETLRDLMDREDLLDEDAGYEEGPLSNANDVEEEKRKKLREQMRLEEDMKRRMRMDKMKDQKAREEQIRENLLAEEESIMHSLKESGYHHSIPTHKESRRPLSMPSILPSNVEKEKDEREKTLEAYDTKKTNGKNVFNRFLRKSTTSDSHLLSGSSSNGLLEDAVNGAPPVSKQFTGRTTVADSSRIPSPPPIPKIEYLLSKLPKSKQIQISNLIRAESLLSNSSDGNDSDTASVGSSHSRSSGGSSGKKKRRDSSPAQRRHNKPGTSPPLPRRARVRKLTPYVKTDGMRRPPAPSPKRLFYDEPLPMGQLSPRHASPSPTISPFSSGASSRNITPSSSFRDELIRSQSNGDPNSPYDFMKAVNTKIATAPNRPKVMRQNAVDEDGEDGSVSPTLLEIEHQLEAMQQMVDRDMHSKNNQFTSPMKTSHDSDEDDDEESTSSSTETSSEDEDDMDEFVQLNVIKPYMQSGGAVNIHAPKRKLSPISINGGLSGGVINRGRLVQKRQVYRPRMYSRRRFSRLDTIQEESEERLHTGTPEERAIAFWSLRLQQKVLKGWSSYTEFMKVAYYNAEDMYQKRTRDLVTKVFYSWVQVRNYGALDKINQEKAESHDRTVTLTKAMTAWRHAMQLVETKPLEAIKQLKSSAPTKPTVQTTPLRTSLTTQSTSDIKPVEAVKQLKILSSTQPTTQRTSFTKTQSISEIKPAQAVKQPRAPSSIQPTKTLTKTANTQSAPLIIAAKSVSRSELKANKVQEYLAWLNKYLKPIGEHANDLEDSVADGVYVLLALGEASGKKVPRYHDRAILPLQRMSNWKLVTDFMKDVGINVRGIEPEDLTNNNVACLHNMFANILKWEAKRL